MAMLPNLEVKDSLLDPDSNDRTARLRNPSSSNPLYRVFIYLEGLRLPYINAVTYILHCSFKNPTRQVFRTDSNPRCKLEMWTWSVFQVQAIATDQDGNTFTLTHDLQYTKDFPAVKFIAA